MTEVLRPDICVIGAGAGGLAVAKAAAARGKSIVLTENGPIGAHAGTGSLASAALIAAARRAEMARRAARFGVMTQRPVVDFAKVHDHVQSVIAAAAPNHSNERYIGLGVQVIDGVARFTGRDTVAVGDVEIKARHFVIAIGSHLAILPIPGLKETPHLTTETVFGLTQCPEHLVVIGVGKTGLELGQAFRRLGAQVTMLDAARPLADEDQECAAILLDQLARDGIAIRSGVEIARVEPVGAKVRVLLRRPDGEDAVNGTHILFATPRRVDTGSLNLASAGIRLENEHIVVDGGLRTSNKQVYAIGEVTGAPRLAHLANHHADIVVRRTLLGFSDTVREDAVAEVVSTDPELAWVGLSEAEARTRHGGIRVVRSAFRDNARAQAEREILGHIKVIAVSDGRILGTIIVGARAGEMITAWTLAIRHGLKVDDVADLAVPYPTLAEPNGRPPISYASRGLTRPWVRRIIALVPRSR